jgi:hypothetical protein
MLLLGILLLPGLVGLIVDPSNGRAVGRSAILCGLAASVRPVLGLWRSGPTVAAGLAAAGDFSTVGWAWLAGGLGWLLAELAPFIVRMALDAKDAQQTAKLRKARELLEAEWGLPPLEAGDDRGPAPR